MAGPDIAAARHAAQQLGLPWLQPAQDAVLRARLTDDGLLIYECPGCGLLHGIPVVRGHHGFQGGPWQWNGSLSNPTLQPSVHVLPAPPDVPRCHHHVRDGWLEFCGDCDHDKRSTRVRMLAAE